MAEETDDNTVTDNDNLLGGLPLPTDDDAATTTTPAPPTPPATPDAPATPPTEDAPAEPAEPTEPTEPATPPADGEAPTPETPPATPPTLPATPPAAAAPPTTPATPPKSPDSPAPAASAPADLDAAFWAKHDELLGRLKSGAVDSLDLKPADLAIIAEGSAKARAAAAAVDQSVRAQRQAAEQITAYESGWNTWQAANPDVKDGRAMWEQELARAKAEHGDNDVAVGAAKVLFGQRVAIVKGRAKAPPAPPAPAAPAKPAAPAAAAAPKGRTSVAPLGAGNRPAPAREMTAEELLVKETGGDGKGFLS
jgi:hypothetical protein